MYIYIYIYINSLSFFSLRPGAEVNTPCMVSWHLSRVLAQFFAYVRGVVPKFTVIAPNLGAITPNLDAIAPNFGAIAQNLCAIAPTFGAIAPNLGAI